MTARSKSHGSIEALIGTFSDWLRHRRELNEMRQFERADFDRIAYDLRVSPDELEQLVRNGPHAADELPKLLSALGIDEATLANTQPFLLRDMERVCAMCEQKRQCDRDLANGASAEHYKDYCANAPTIERLGETLK
jgi:transcriptional regulator with XRE-family HTH domain